MTTPTERDAERESPYETLRRVEKEGVIVMPERLAELELAKAELDRRNAQNAEVMRLIQEQDEEGEDDSDDPLELLRPFWDKAEEDSQLVVQLQKQLDLATAQAGRDACEITELRRELNVAQELAVRVGKRRDYYKEQIQALELVGEGDGDG